MRLFAYMTSIPFFRLTTLTLACMAATAVMAEPTDNPANPTLSKTESDLPTIVVRASAHKKGVHSDSEAVKSFPASVATVTKKDSETTTNVMNTEDMVKYLPDLLVRKRYIGDTQAPIATRTTGVNASARSLIFADGVLLSTLINNNNGNGSPQWFMVSPEEISRINVLYGPYSAAYAGNSYGAVIDIVTRMPDHFEATATMRGAIQDFKLYNTKDHFGSGELSTTLGDRNGNFAWWLSANHLDSSSQPLTFATLSQSSTPATTQPVMNGAIAGENRTGSPIQILGAGNITHTIQDNVKLKLAYDFSPTLSANYVVGFWRNDADAHSESYLSSAADQSAYYGATSGKVNIGGYAYNPSSIAGLFSRNEVSQQHLMQSLTLKTNHSDGLNWEVVASHFDYLKDLTRLSNGPYVTSQSGGSGQITDASGTGWSTLDLKSSYHFQNERLSNHTLSGGLHGDWYRLDSQTYSASDWRGAEGALTSASQGKTQTTAAWLQDVWMITPKVKATIGGRYEDWQATNGYNLSTANSKLFSVNQPNEDKTGFSPKASVAWSFAPNWTLTGSSGKALRFPTVGELYQNVQTGTTYTQANPNLKPENVLSHELALARETDDSSMRLSIFQERVKDALISQTAMISGYATPVSYTQNVDKTRQRGIEFTAAKQNVLIDGLDFSGSISYVDAKILANSSYVPTIAGATSVGKHTPYVPAWRATLVGTYHISPEWSFTTAGRYIGRQYATVDNTDTFAKTYQGFQPFFVMDIRTSYQLNHNWSAAAGIDNLNNSKYFLYHPFPERTFYAEVKYTY